MKKKILLTVMMTLWLTGCAKVTNEYDKVETGIVIDKNYQNEYITIVMVPMHVGKVTTMRPYPIVHPAQYDITFDVNGYKVYWDNKNIYNTYDINDKANIIIHYKEYDDGTIKKQAKGIAE